MARTFDCNARRGAKRLAKYLKNAVVRARLPSGRYAAVQHFRAIVL